MDNIIIFFTLYFVLISAVSSVICIFDKAQSKKGGWRVRESTLLWLSFLGGAAAMFFVMKIIRHKTKHKKFMIGLPVMMLFHITATVLLFLNLDKSVI